jgi:hypothetical protein
VTGTVRVLRGTALVRSWPVGPAASGTVRWDGTDAKGKAVAEGTYSVVVDVASAAGDPASVESSLLVDRTVRSFTATPARIAPGDGDALARSTRLGWTLARPATTRLAILDPAGTEIRVGDANPAAGSACGRDGRVDGAYVADGVYTIDRATSSLIVDPRRLSPSVPSIRLDRFPGRRGRPRRRPRWRAAPNGTVDHHPGRLPP